MATSKIVSFINMKGGVGKTTLTIGIADYLAKHLNKKILVIDIDPQFNATQTLLDIYSKEDYFDDILPEERTINKLFKPQTEFKRDSEIPSKDEVITTLNENLDLLCGDLNLVLVNKTSDYRQVKKLRRFVRENKLREIYDYILIDCPPTLTVYTDAALLSSDFYLIPNRIDRYSIIGISSLTTAIDNLIHEEDHDIQCLGLVYTMLDNELTQKQTAIKEEFEGQLDDYTYIFDATTTVVRDLQVGKRGSLPTNYQKSLHDISNLSEEFIDQIQKRLDFEK
ncbi:chromosome partitioning protein ParA [Bhargavaea cecembensis]|uniref:Chromosome partitioning protein ParA n=1 Tax=Bhargavaea cecembensis TaxID=394098 RepID=A0A161SR00_9BACL|nr:AAA family ATPase [Bhargavaea cecembensis]KZE37730.1 chromosome partitioning protein ParA [Bhargavaea cecembensis]